MKLIIGLGNPGSSYQNTRHNLGRSVIEFLGRLYRLSFSKKSSLCVSLASVEWEGVPLTLAYPETFMNLSGKAVLALVEHLACQIEQDFLILVDDVSLPFGKMRLRAKGSDGGHQGLRSIHEALGRMDYARLRLGIGACPESEGQEPLKMTLEEYVLQRFNAKERKALPGFLEKAHQACRLWGIHPVEYAMNIVNNSKSTG